MVETGPVIELMKKALKSVRESNITYPIISNEATIACKEVIKIEPKFPFSYFVLAVNYKEKDMIIWKDYALKGVSIFEKTTKIEGHNTHHLQCLETLRKMLNSDK